MALTAFGITSTWMFRLDPSKHIVQLKLGKDITLVDIKETVCTHSETIMASIEFLLLSGWHVSDFSHKFVFLSYTCNHLIFRKYKGIWFLSSLNLHITWFCPLTSTFFKPLKPQGTLRDLSKAAPHTGPSSSSMNSNAMVKKYGFPYKNL